MAKKTKDSKPFSIRMEKSVFERLEQYCNESGQSKTIAIERAIGMYIDDYEEKRERWMQKSENIREV